jgi:hypothetical protein
MGDNFTFFSGTFFHSKELSHLTPVKTVMKAITSLHELWRGQAIVYPLDMKAKQKYPMKEK